MTGTERDDLLVHKDRGIAWITLNRPALRNALTLEQRVYLADLLGRFSGDRSVRVVVLRGAGPSFCSGADLRPEAIAEPAADGGPERVVGDLRRRVHHGAQRLVEAVMDCEKPVIAAVHGAVAGMAVQLVLACDIVLAADDTRLLEVFVQRGLVPDTGAAYLLPRLVGVQKAKEILFLGEAITARSAQSLGLVNAVVEPDRLAQVTEEWAERLAGGATRAIALTKWLVNRSLDTDRIGSFEAEATAVELNAASHDAQEGLTAFVEHRPAQFVGW